jgi:IclR family mhp operon transcriptional activator
MKTVNSLHRGLAVLQAINENGGCQIKDLQKLVNLPKPTIIRMVKTLFEAGYVMRNQSGIYKVAAKVMSLSNRYDLDEDLMIAAKPILKKLREDITWPSDLASFDGDAMVILDTGIAPGTLGLNRSRGARLPVLSTSLGCAYLAFCDSKLQEELLPKLIDAETALEFGKISRKRIQRILRETKANGYAVGDAEYIKSTRAVAVPVLVESKPIATVNLMVVTTAMVMEEVEKLFVKPLQIAAQKIAEAISR